jgi:hypothetical protein
VQKVSFLRFVHHWLVPYLLCKAFHKHFFGVCPGRPKNLYGVHAKLQRKGIADADVSQASI